jgi:hypothetical protein
MADDSVSRSSGQGEIKSTEKAQADELPDPSVVELSDFHEGQKISDPDDKEKEDVQCLCGDEAHTNLEEWYKGYVQSSAEEKVLFNDKFNKAALEEKIQKLLSQVTVSNGYCPSCENLLDKWLEIIKKVPEYHPGGFGEPYQQPHFKDTLEFEAGYRNECRLCTMFVQCSINRGYSLEVWHRLQNRLNCLGESTVILVSVKMDKEYYDLTLTWPGLDNYCWLPADPLYCVKNYDQSVFPTILLVE